MNLRNGVKRLGLVALGVVLAAAVSEGVVLGVFGEQAKFPRRVVGAQWGLRINDPGAHYRQKSADVDVEFRINSKGLRSDREYEYAKPEGVKRIVALGDSFTAGYEVSVEESFCRVLEAELRNAGVQVEVINAGVSGFGNAEQCLYLERELIRYEPDLVLLSFFNNDLKDNVRSNLFRLAGDELQPARESYIPLGGFGNFLNTSWVFNELSARSNAFVLVKERVTSLIKQNRTRSHSREVSASSEGGGGAMQARLAGAILERVRDFCAANGAAFVVQNIPKNTPSHELVSEFPSEYVSLDREGAALLDMKPVLDEFKGRELLYWERSHGHWTPFSHRLSGERLAALILEEGLLD